MEKRKHYTYPQLFWLFAKMPLTVGVSLFVGGLIGINVVDIKPRVETVEIIKAQAFMKCVEYPSYITYPVGSASLSDYNHDVWVVVEAESTEEQAETVLIEGIGNRRIYGYWVRTGTSGKVWMRADYIDNMKEVSCDDLNKVTKRK